MDIVNRKEHKVNCMLSISEYSIEARLGFITLILYQESLQIWHCSSHTDLSPIDLSDVAIAPVFGETSHKY